MRLISLSLKNIRSYTNSTILFPEGSTLLSGDVGAGKTTILLAIEFSLFGLLRGELAASSLLRHGAADGEVSLTFMINQENYVLTRSLKRDASSVKQGNGSLNGESMTPVELKAKVLHLLGYGQDLLTKAKSLVFRYTVYTPQEAMKQILFESPDARLETIRQLFGMDQYKRAQTNAQVLLKELRSEQKALAIQLEELPHKERSRKELVARLAKEDEERMALSRQHAAAEKAANAQEDAWQAAKGQADYYQRCVQELATANALHAQAAARLERTAQQSDALARQLATLSVKETGELKDALKKKEAQQAIIEDRLRQARAKQATLQAKEAQARQAKAELAGLASNCPLCKQAVPHEHKSSLLAQQQAIMDEAAASLRKAEAFITQAEEKQRQVKQSWQGLNTQIMQAASDHARKEQLTRQQEQLIKERGDAQATLQAQQAAMQAKEAEVKSLAPVQESLKEQEATRQATQRAVQELVVQLARLEATQKAEKQQLAQQDEEITRLQKHVARHKVLAGQVHWLKESFVPLAQAIEQAVFASLHREFDQLFQSWFNQLLEDDTLQVRLDRSFTPLITLNGYDTDLEALSGGEKTAVALAYRLSLNQVINEFLTTIQTRDLLILDEPTDGFSSQQLDRMRDVLEQLKVGQLLLVSHEPKVEGFVEQVIRVSKQEQTSVIEQ